jgi:triosephosphate isomerase (TIM)
MRKQIAAGNWKMNLSYQEADTLLSEILKGNILPGDRQQVIFGVPYPYLVMARSAVEEEMNYEIAAQNCHHKSSGAYTGEVSASMLQSLAIRYCIVGHSERREYFQESNQVLAEKVDICLENRITPIFCCGEALEIREKETQNDFVQKQLEESLFHLDKNKISGIIIAYEPIWAIGTGRTASSQQAQDMHAHIRSVIAGKYGAETADKISILYGGSVKASNAKELFANPDVDGGLVGGASLNAQEFVQIIKALKS